MSRASKSMSRRAVLGTGIATALLQTLPAAAQNLPKPTVLDDASRLNLTPVTRHRRPDQVRGDAWLGALRARAEGGGGRASTGRSGRCAALDGRAGAHPRRGRDDLRREAGGEWLDRRRPSGEDLSRRRRGPVEPGDRRARSRGLLARGDAVQPRLRRRGDPLRERARLARLVRSVRDDGPVLPRDARLRRPRSRARRPRTPSSSVR